MNRITKFIFLLIFMVLPVRVSFAESEHIKNLLYEKNYQSCKVGDIVWNQYNYNITVSADPHNQNNLVLKQVFGANETEGFMPHNYLYASDTSDGLLVIEEELMFSINSGRSYEHGMYMRSVDGNNGFQLWTGTNHYLYGVYPENNKWYKVTCAVDIDAEKYKIYIQDNNGLLIREITEMYLPGGFDYSQGFNMFYKRFTGTGSLDDAIYVDNVMCYKSESTLLDEKIRYEDSLAKENLTYYSDELCSALSDSTVLYINNPYAYVGNKVRQIDKENVAVVPEVFNNRTYVPIRFVSESLGSDVAWDGTQNKVTLSLNNKNVQMTVGSKKILVDGKAIMLDSPVMVKNDRTIVPIRAVLEAFDKTVMWYDEGFVVIGAKERLSEALVRELYDARYFVSKPADLNSEKHTLSSEEAALRNAAFSNRNSDEEIKKLATEFFKMIDLSIPELKMANMYYNSGQYVRALKEYRAFAFAALKTMDEDYWNWNFAYKYDSSNAGNKGVADNSDKMFFDVITNPSGVSLNLGNPGAINWAYNLPDTPANPGGYAGQSNFMWNYSLYDPLFYSFYGTGKISYLTKWSEFIDDWCINENSFSKLLPPQIPDSHNSNSVASTFIYQLRLLAKQLPDSGEGFSELTMARAMTKIIKEYPIVTVEYMRSNPQNWTPGFAAAILSTGLQLEKLGFKYSDYYVRAGLRRAEDFSVTQMSPDGTETETTMGYLTEYVKYNPVVTQLIRKYKPDIVADEWYIEQEDNLYKASELVIRLLVPGATYPAGFRDTLLSRATQVEELLNNVAPHIINKNENKKILDAVRGWGNDDDIEFTSIWYPNGGFYSIKDGWTPGSQSGFMYSAPYPYHRATGDNMFVLSAFGRDMLVAGEVGAYDSIRSQILVDGKSQNATVDRTFWGHRNAMVSASDEVGKFRWLSDGSIDFMEGSYSGPYGSGAGIVSDTAHDRQISFLKECGLWIVCDRLSGEQNHTYTQKWRIPVKPTGNSGKEYNAFDVSEITIENHTLKTNQKDNANLSIYYFSNNETAHSGYTEHKDDSNAYKISDFYCVDTSFSGSGNNMLISVIYPRADLETDIVSIAEKESENPNICGFSAELKDGTEVEYMVSADKSESVSCKGIEAECESLLVKEKDGVLKGIVLSCTGMKINGEEYLPEASDFEFEISGGNIKCTNKLDMPIETVKIHPDKDVFVESLEIQMAAEENDVLIRYTLDGSEPCRESQIYTQPVVLTDTTIVKARAYRTGKDGSDCTAVSPVTTAVFTKKALKPATELKSPAQGVECEYYEGEWKKAFVSLDWCEPVKTGTASAIFDISMKNTQNDFAFRYSGYINAPESGIYTFYAPEEYIKGDIMEGYELNIYIDDELWYPKTQRHAFGTWSVALEAGYHKICVEYSDCRGELPAFFNTMGPQKIMWDGNVPEVILENPAGEKQDISSMTLYR